MEESTVYEAIIGDIFSRSYTIGATSVTFEREDLVEACQRLNLAVPKNLGDVIYTFRYRVDLPEVIRATAPEGMEWIIRPAGRARYRFDLIKELRVAPNPNLVETMIPDATPGIIDLHALNDEQSLLAKLRYNRLIDIFTGLTCYSLQNHLRTTIPNGGQVETDEVYVALDKRGAQYVIPVQAKGGNDRIGVVQIEQDLAIGAKKFPHLICRPVAAQFMPGGVIALFEFEEEVGGSIGIVSEKHYRLVPPDQISAMDLLTYQRRPDL